MGFFTCGFLLRLDPVPVTLCESYCTQTMIMLTILSGPTAYYLLSDPTAYYIITLNCLVLTIILPYCLLLSGSTEYTYQALMLTIIWPYCLLLSCPRA